MSPMKNIVIAFHKWNLAPAIAISCNDEEAESLVLNSAFEKEIMYSILVAEMYAEDADKEAERIARERGIPFRVVNS